MSSYLLDTNIISDLIRNSGGPAACHIERVGPKDLNVENWL